MKTCENPACDRPAASGWGICRGCHRRTALHLSDLADDLTAELEVTLTGQGHIGPGRVGSRSTLTVLPFNAHASEVVTDAHTKLVAWCLLLRDEAGARLPEDTIHDMAIHLTGWLDWLAKHPAVGEFADEIAIIVAEIERAIDLPPTRSRIFVGACPEIYEDPCPGELWASFPRDDQRRPGIACTVCEATYEPEQWNRLGGRMLGGIGGNRDQDGAKRLMRTIFGVGA